MRQYSEAFRSRMVERMTGPRALSATALSREVGVAQPVLSRWLVKARNGDSVAGMRQSPKQKAAKRSGAEKLRVVLEASALTGSELGALLRREGIHEAELQEWRAAAEAALGEPPRNRAKPSGDASRIKELERELHRKEKALAEAAALLVLKKKVRELWGDEDDTTDARSGR